MNILRIFKAQPSPADVNALRAILDDRAHPGHALDNITNRKVFEPDAVERLVVMTYESVSYFLDTWCECAILDSHMQARVKGEVPNKPLAYGALNRRIAALLPIGKDLLSNMCHAIVNERFATSVMKAAKAVTAAEEATKASIPEQAPTLNFWNALSKDLLATAEKSLTSIEEVAVTDPRFAQMPPETLANVMAMAHARQLLFDQVLGAYGAH